MKNWIIVLLVFTIPLGLYAYFETNTQATVAKEEMTANKTQKPRVIKFYSPMCSDCQKVSKEMVGVGEDFKDHVASNPLPWAGLQPPDQAPQGPSNLALNAFRDGASTTSLDSCARASQTSE